MMGLFISVGGLVILLGLVSSAFFFWSAFRNIVSVRKTV